MRRFYEEMKKLRPYDGDVVARFLAPDPFEVARG